MTEFINFTFSGNGAPTCWNKDGVDDNNIGCLKPHGNSAGTEGTILFHGVDGDESHLTHLTHEVDCCLMERKKQNACCECQDHAVPNVMKSRNDIYDGVYGGESHLTHLTQEVDYCVMERKKQTACVPNTSDRKEVDVGVDDHVDRLVDGCVDDSVAVAVEDGVYGCVNDGGESHLTDPTQEVDYCVMERKE
eukprot:4241047-Ditylum_brightwellii.AAC.1